jgi:uncharacterized protein YprB with RNaseH-like and TPR domain
LPPGEEVQTDRGVAFRIENRYPGDQRHGKAALADLLSFDSALAAEVAADESLREVRPEALVFVDLETTGLVGGAGTIGFLVGVGAFDGGSFRLRQYFLRDPEEEPAMLEALRDDLEAADGVVSFNGRSFDLPLLQNRYTMALRDRWRITEFPHLDLLYPSRRLWKSTLADCRLSTLEQSVLGIQRTDQDVPGDQIPGMYLDYLRTGDATEMSKVIYHNTIDILSLVGLASRVLNRYEADDPAILTSGEALAVARWHQNAGRATPAEAAYRMALEDRSPKEIRLEAVRRLTQHLKREGRRKEAVSDLEAWHALTPGDPAPCIELSMYYEWHAKDLPRALKWAQLAMRSLSSSKSGWRRERMAAEIEHRLSRIERKLAD